MPRYHNEFGVQIDIPEEKAARINGLIPVDDVKPSPRRRTRKPKTPKPC